MPSIAETEHFQDRSRFVAQRIRTCGYRFYKLIQARKQYIPKLNDAVGNPRLQDEVRDKVLQTADEYVNCLRSHHRGGEIPEYLVGSVNNFKEQVYTRLAPQFVLEDLGLNIANTIFNENYKM